MLELWHERRFELVISDELLEEVDQVLRRKKLRALHRRSDQEIDTLMKDLKTVIRVVPVSDIDVPALAGRDPDDLVVVATGKAGRVDYIVTRDEDLHSLGEVIMSVELVAPGCEALNLSPLVIKIVKDYFHIHTYGGLTPFFEGLRQSKLLGTRCPNRACEENRIWLPPRVYCPDCLGRMEWVEAPQTGEIWTHTTVAYPGSNFKLSTPCPLISVSIEGVCTKMMSYLKEGEPEIGMKVVAWFRTENPTHTILDLAWVPA